MADQVFEVTSGFYDAIDQDRVYTADDMNKPYKRIVADGVFATQLGTPSSDLQVTASGTDMNVVVAQGNGIFGNKWFENPSPFPITVPINSALQPRLDSVIAQVDLRVSGRVGNIVYRTGTAATTPTPPAINQIPDVIEYRLANVRVAAGASKVAGSAVTDLRGSAECPWVTSLIQQVDTSTLWEQFQAAYTEQYEQFAIGNQQYIEQERQAWEDFIQSLTSDLNVSMNVVTLRSDYQTIATTKSIPIDIPSYNSATDVLQVFINGLYADSGKYVVDVSGTAITLETALPAGNLVSFVVFKSLVGGSIESAVSMIERLDDKMDAYMADSGWINLVLENGATAFNSNSVPAVRSVGNRVYIRGAIKGLTAITTTIATIPAGFRPSGDVYFVTTSNGTGGAVAATIGVKINATTGTIQFVAKDGTINSGDMTPLSVDYISNNPYPVDSVFNYKGTVSTRANLPTSGNMVGDYYVISSTGESVVWNGVDWVAISDAITTSQISAIVNSIE